MDVSNDKYQVRTFGREDRDIFNVVRDDNGTILFMFKVRTRFDNSTGEKVTELEFTVHGAEIRDLRNFDEHISFTARLS